MPDKSVPSVKQAESMLNTRPAVRIRFRAMSSFTITKASVLRALPWSSSNPLMMVFMSWVFDVEGEQVGAFLDNTGARDHSSRFFRHQSKGSGGVTSTLDPPRNEVLNDS